MSLLPITRAFLTHPTARPALKDPNKYALRELRAIVVHWTANTNKGANAMANRNYFNLGSRPASAHFVVDDRTVVQCLPETEVGYHCGDTPLGPGVYKPAGKDLMKGYKGLTPNYFTIGIEMCVNSDGDWSKTLQNTWDLVAFLLVKHKLLTPGSLLRHYDVTGKQCPAMYIDRLAWLGYTAKVMEAIPTYSKSFPAKVNSKGLNLRAGAGTDFPVIVELKQGEPVVMLETVGSWTRVETGGWVNNKYLIGALGT